MTKVSNKQIRILQIGMHDQVGGVENFLLNYYKHIDRNRIQFDFINQYDKLCFEEKIKKMNGRIYKVTNVKKNPIKYYFELKKIVRQYDTIHINMLSAANILPIMVASRCNTKNIIVHSHCNGITDGFLRRILNFINKKYLIKKANIFFACSEEAGKWMFGDKEFKIIKNGIDINRFTYNENRRKKIRKELNIEKKLVFGHIGRFDEEKNHKLLIDIFENIHKKNSDTVLLLIGDGKLKNNIIEMVKEKKLDDCIIMVGVKDNPQDYYCAFDEFIFPSKFEGLGIVAIEAQISGLPCLISNKVPKEVKITNNVEFFNINDDSEKIANCALNLINHNNSRKNIEIKENYDINYLSTKLQEIYLEVSKKRIVHFVYGLVNGGVEKMLINYFSRNNKDKYDIHIVTQQDSEKSCVQKFIDLGFNIYRVPEKKHLIGYCCSVNKLMKKIKPDIVHSHMTESNFLPNMIAKVNGVKYRISHSHSFLPNCSIKNKVFLYIGKKVSNIYVACSKEAGIYAFGKSVYFKIIYNAFNVRDYSYSNHIRNKKRKELGLKNEFILLNIGRMVDQKNQLRLLEIFKEYQKIDSDSKLIIIGDGQLRNKIIKKINILNLNNIILISKTSNVNEYLQMADCFLFPTKFEGLGIVLVEAQAASLPVITSSVVPQEVKINGNDSFTILDLNDNDIIWAKSISSIKKSKKTRSLDTNLIMRKTHYNINVEYKNLFDMYDQLT